MNHHRDGAAQHRIHKGQINYWPNRHGVGHPVPVKEGGYTELVFNRVSYDQILMHTYRPMIPGSGTKQRLRGSKFQEHYNQAQLFYNSLSPIEKLHLINAISFELSHCDDKNVYEAYTRLLNNVDFELAKKVAQNVNGVVPDKPARENHGKSDPTLSQEFYFPKEPTIATRRIAVLIDDGFNLLELEAVRTALASAKATTWVIGPRRGKVYADGETVGSGQFIVADHHFEGQRSTLFDAVYIPSGSHAKTLASNGRAIHWIREAFGHCKAIGAVGEGAWKSLFFLLLFVELFDPAVATVECAIGLKEVQIIRDLDSDDVVVSYGVVTTGKYNFQSAVVDILSITSEPKGFVSNFACEISKHRCFDRELDGLVAKVAF